MGCSWMGVACDVLLLCLLVRCAGVRARCSGVTVVCMLMKGQSVNFYAIQLFFLYVVVVVLEHSLGMTKIR